MMRLHLRARPKMRWLVMDATAMKARSHDSRAGGLRTAAPDALYVFVRQFADGAFDTVVDKGALDALMGEPGEAAERAGSALLAESARVTSPSGGRVLVVSLLQDHVLETLLRTFRAGWRLSVTQVPPAADMRTSPLQPFLVVAQAVSSSDDDVDTSSSGGVPLVELHTPRLTAGGGGQIVNAEQQRDVALLIRRENAARQASAAAGVRARMKQSCLPCEIARH